MSVHYFWSYLCIYYNYFTKEILGGSFTIFFQKNLEKQNDLFSFMYYAIG